MPPLLLALAACASTLTGGALALRLRHRLHTLLAFTAGVLLGAVAFELLPQMYALAREHGFDPAAAMIALVSGFLLFHALEKFVLVHPTHESHYAHHHHPQVGVASALVLCCHSVMDGMAIGVGYQVSPAVGMTVALAVIAHDFSDGLNTVGLMLRHGNAPARARAMLALDAAAPLVGVLAAMAVDIAPHALMVYLGFFAGFLLYIAVSDILPEAHSRATAGSAVGLIALTCLGAAFVYAVARYAP